jgi:outer membrane protein assembly factor BamB
MHCGFFRATTLSFRALIAVNLAGVASTARADWPQWRGPLRDDVSQETGLLKSWPEGGPPRVWHFEDCGLGYSGPAIVGDRLYIMGSRDGVELLLAIDVTTGKEVWHAEIGKEYENDYGNGPRGTPTVDGERVYALGAQGTLVCVNRADGNVLWTKSMEDLGGKTPQWGYCESPLVHDELVLCTPGGEQGAVAAFDKISGELAWQTADEKSGAGYSSIVPHQCNGSVELVQLLPQALVGLDPASGKTLWKEGFPGSVAVIPTPVIRDNLVYVAAGYGAGCMLVEVGPDFAAKKLYDNKTMVNHHGGVILVGDSVYGYSDGKGWVCQDLKSGDMTWHDKDALGKGAVACADGMLYCLSEDGGEAVLVEPSTKAWKEVSRFTLDPQTELRKPKGKIWTHPVVCDGKLYLRDQNLLFCFDVKDAAQQ